MDVVAVPAELVVTPRADDVVTSLVVCCPEDLVTSVVSDWLLLGDVVVFPEELVVMPRVNDVVTSLVVYSREDLEAIDVRV